MDGRQEQRLGGIVETLATRAIGWQRAAHIDMQIQ